MRLGLLDGLRACDVNSTNLVMNPLDWKTAVDPAGGMNDRGLFLFALVVPAAMVLAVARYFVRQHVGKRRGRVW